MTFTNNTVTIGKYRVSSARRADDGSVGFILDEGGTLVNHSKGRETADILVGASRGLRRRRVQAR